LAMEKMKMDPICGSTDFASKFSDRAPTCTIARGVSLYILAGRGL
jgi:hypothetical protein